MLYHGPVRVPDDAQPGKAVIRVELPAGSKYETAATDIPVELVRLKPKK
ncbi:MAG TPA: hypothetical protein VFG68_22255 [Fimbriiglobus sp.]|nr:hypothetical protein [Fimbriiglobus sp.]